MKLLRDTAIVFWVVMQGLSWMFPQAYGHFNATADVSYQDTMEKLEGYPQPDGLRGVWDE